MCSGASVLAFSILANSGSAFALENRTISSLRVSAVMKISIGDATGGSKSNNTFQQIAFDFLHRRFESLLEIVQCFDVNLQRLHSLAENVDISHGPFIRITKVRLGMPRRGRLTHPHATSICFMSQFSKLKRRKGNMSQSVKSEVTTYSVQFLRRDEIQYLAIFLHGRIKRHLLRLRSRW